MRFLLIAYEFPPSPSPQSLRWAYLVRELIALGHQVKVRSRPGRGSCFSVLVPVAGAPTPSVAARAAAPPPPRASDIDDVRVLVIDNDQAVLDGMTRLLMTWRCQAVAVAGRGDAQTRLAAFRPDVILADYHLDGRDLGTTLITDLRRQLGAEVVAAVITADRSPEVQAEVRHLPSVSLLTKPIKPARLRALIASVRR